MEIVSLKIIDSSQTGYVRGRHIAGEYHNHYGYHVFNQDANILGQAIFHDLDKAFDSIEWHSVFRNAWKLSTLVLNCGSGLT